MTLRPSTARTWFGSNGSIKPCSSAIRRIHLSLLIVMSCAPCGYSRWVRRLPFLAACALWLAPPAHAQPPREWKVDVAGGAVVFAGRIEQRSVDEFLRALGEHPEVTRLVITS